MGAGRMTDKQVFHFAATVDKKRGGRALQESVGVGRIKQLHGGRQRGANGVMWIIGARLPKTAASH
ncbi:hypothetical protein PSUB009319_37280 [Ralstonia sp. SET104]|nr:hypothetical protein PSUB009319_37280 [Ralstonia sp. SET104]